MTEHKYILVGTVVKPHSIRGELCVEYYADSPFLLDQAVAVFVCPVNPETDQPLRTPAKGEQVLSWREHKGRILLRLKFVADRNKAEELRNFGVFIREEDFPPLDDDDVYLYQLEGCDALLPDRSLLGRIEGFLMPSAEQEIMVIRTPGGKEVLLPVTDETLLEFDLDAGWVEVAPPEGLLDIYLSES